MIGKILMAYDGSENGRRALDVAAELARELDAELTILHVLMHGRPANEVVRMAEIEHLVKEVRESGLPGFAPVGVGAYEMLDTHRNEGQSARVIAAIGDKLLHYANDRSKELGVQKVSTLAQAGDFADEILDTAEATDADMIVIGSRGLGTVRGTVLGSVSQKVLHHADQIVVTVK